VAEGAFLSGEAQLINANARTLFDFRCRRRLASIKFELLQCLRLGSPDGGQFAWRRISLFASLSFSP